MKVRKALTQDELYAIRAAFDAGRQAKDLAQEFDIRPQTARRFYVLFREGWDGKRVRHVDHIPKRDRKPNRYKPHPAPHAMPWCTYDKLTGGRA